MSARDGGGGGGNDESSRRLKTAWASTRPLLTST
jgi:hypothetical protein